jgi:hypothetical protein
MNVSLHYAAFSYLDEWIWRDSRFHQTLRYETWQGTSADLGARELAKAATYYGVARTLKKTNEEPRLMGAYEELGKTRLLEENEVPEVVERFAEKLHTIYGTHALSAASKFLWLKFRSPVVIYDSMVSKWICKNCEYRDDGYANYFKYWHEKFPEYEERIKEACAELVTPIVKGFTLACDVADDQLSEWTTSRWFRERVFDHFMMAEIDVAEEKSARARLA